MHSNITTVLIY